MNYELINAYKFAEKAVITVKVEATHGADIPLIAQDLLSTDQELFKGCFQVVLMLQDTKGYSRSMRFDIK